MSGKFFSTNIMYFMAACTLVFFINTETPAQANNWKIHYSEKFTDVLKLTNGMSFGKDKWLTARIRGGGSITTGNGIAHFETPDFKDSALIQITKTLPDDYKITVKIGNVKYSINNYTDNDFGTKGFKYNRRYLENGFYWLAITDRLIEESSGEDWWHRYRKIVIDSDDHIGERYPVYMVYMNPDLNRAGGDWIGGMPNLLRCWSNGKWVTSEDNWEVAFRYDERSTYIVEFEKLKNMIIFRAFNEDGSLIAETEPVSADKVYGMGKQASSDEFAFIGEPHIDSYKGSAHIKEIQLSIPDK